jgi:hypothetical protein
MKTTRDNAEERRSKQERQMLKENEIKSNGTNKERYKKNVWYVKSKETERKERMK